jgi:hypothetical protein
MISLSVFCFSQGSKDERLPYLRQSLDTWEFSLTKAQLKNEMKAYRICTLYFKCKFTL